ncbi:MAG: CCA tRNA nucleotidyltransferase [Sedimentisphaerales bacterium]|nr:CCA tRNA nucleotidyltransferase [Sedimentisphaerales bacterium]
MRDSNPDRSARLSARQAVRRVVRRLRQAGHEALLAGGCVRDMLLGKRPQDYDVATSARPQEVTALFGRTLTVGAKFGVVIVILGGRQIEVATFRSDRDYPDGRRPQAVVFTDARHDAERRDFTINGMFYDLAGERVIDYVGGRRDLARGVVRAIGNPDDRFGEDHLRLLRAVRFACRLDFRIEAATWQAMIRQAPKLSRISPERIGAEWEMILVDPRRDRGLELARQSGLLAVSFPDLEDEVLQRGIETVCCLPGRCSFSLVLAALLVETQPPQANRVCRRLRLSNERRNQVLWLVGRRRMFLESAPQTPGRLKQWLSEPLFESLVQLLRSWLRAAGQSQAICQRLRRQIQDLGDEPIAPPRLLDGHELIRLGAVAGPMVGQIAEELYLAQLENQVKTVAQARDWVQRWLGEHLPDRQ